jgi:hypothetical protein
MFLSLCLPTVLLAWLPLAATAGAQDSASAPAPASRHAPVCADGVRQYSSLADVPQPFDTLILPKGPPIHVTSPEQASVAQRLMMDRVGRLGATGMVTLEESHESDGGARMVRRRVIPVFVPADSARAQAACHGAAADMKGTAQDSSR